MFSLASGVYAHYFSPQQLNLLVIGVQGSGKTTVLERIKVTEFAHQSVSNDNSNNATAATAAAALVNHDHYKNSHTHNNNNNGSSVTMTATTSHEAAASVIRGRGVTTTTAEHLRSKIFVSDVLEEYDGPPMRRSKANNNRHRHRRRFSHPQSPPPVPKSIFRWICPAPPKFRPSRLDLSDRKYSDTEFNTGNGDHDDVYPSSSGGGDDDNYDYDNEEFGGDDDDDESSSMIGETASLNQHQLHRTNTTVLAPSRRTMRRTSSAGNLRVQLQQQLQQQPHGGGPVGLPAPRRISERVHTLDELRRSSMETVDLGPTTTTTATTNSRPPPTQLLLRRAASNDSIPPDDTFNNNNNNSWNEHSHRQHQQQSQRTRHHPQPQFFDEKPGAKMLPLEKIRPTIGMNLAKTEICGAKVHVWDLGGKLHDMWERYYADADAVLFVWKLCRDDVARHHQQQQQQQQQSSNGGEEENDDRSGDDDDRPPVATAEWQRKVLEQVRSAVPDDVPLVVLGHLFQKQPPYHCEPDVLYSTSQLIPYYHNPYQALFLANAATGQGIKTALEWLISTAKRQQRIRERSMAEANRDKH